MVRKIVMMSLVCMSTVVFAQKSTSTLVSTKKERLPAVGSLTWLQQEAKKSYLVYRKDKTSYDSICTEVACIKQELKQAKKLRKHEEIAELKSTYAIHSNREREIYLRGKQSAKKATIDQRKLDRVLTKYDSSFAGIIRKIFNNG